MVEATKKLADLAVQIRYKNLPPEAVSKAKECILDTLGCMLGGCKGEEASILLRYIEEAGGRPEFPSVVQPTTSPEPAIEAVPTKEGGTCT